VTGKNAPKKRPSWRAWWPLSRTEAAVQSEMGRAPVRWACTVKERTGSLGKEEREMRGVEVVREIVRSDRLEPDPAWAKAIVLPVLKKVLLIPTSPKTTRQEGFPAKVMSILCEYR